MSSKHIIIRGAREHNLQNISLRLPRNKLIVITGLSGSGKSSLAFDTIYAEGQRRYVESLSAYARQFLEQMNKPDVDSIEGLSPAISIEQKNASRNPRSTVATVTEIYDHMRLLFARLGKPHCPNCGKAIESLTIQQMTDQVMSLPAGERFTLIAPVVRGRKGSYKKEFEEYLKQGHVRLRVDGEDVYLSDLESIPELDKKRKHDIEVLVDRLKMREGLENRLAQGLELALTLADGLALVEASDGERQFFSEHFGCLECGVSYPEISPRLFSFNSPYGACPDCHGLGVKMYFDPELVIPDDRLSIGEGAILAWPKSGSFTFQALETVLEAFDESISTPVYKLSKKALKATLYGTRGMEIKFDIRSSGGMRHSFIREFEGVIPNLERRYQETQSEAMREEMERYMNYQVCPACGGDRLRPEALHVTLEGKNIIALTRLTIENSLDFFDNLTLDKRDEQIAERLLKEIRARLGFLVNVGLDYLSLDRSSGTLSGGESQRIRLATQIGSQLVGVLYILDEPSIGLHQRDNDRLLATLKAMRDIGNTVIVVEHDEDTILAADHVVDIGPGAGIRGGRIVAQGPPKKIMADKNSLTGRYLKGELLIPLPAHRRNGDARKLIIKGCRANNLKKINVTFPLGSFICITGVSGSGKSSLIMDTLLPTLKHRLRRRRKKVNCDSISGVKHLDKIIAIDQSPIGRTPRSNPATYVQVFTPIRELFSQLPEARARGYKPGRFSFNVKGGRCEACEGAGVNRIEMHFLPDIFVECEQCAGKRYSRETLEIRYRGRTVSDVLGMTVNQAFEFFEHHAPIRNRMKTLREVGLGYIRLGQAATTLSGGEAQRIKLSKELAKRSTGRTLYILDEPTTGLHFDDINKLLDVLNRLAETGNTVIVIEHNLDVIKTADYIVDLGPEGGDKGGKVVACGSPEQITKVKASYTGRYLKPKLKKVK